VLYVDHKLAVIGRCSPHVMLRDINHWLARGVLDQTGGRSVVRKSLLGGRFGSPRLHKKNGGTKIQWSIGSMCQLQSIKTMDFKCLVVRLCGIVINQIPSWLLHQNVGAFSGVGSELWHAGSAMSIS
jgi:hypothetical protein